MVQRVVDGDTVDVVLATGKGPGAHAGIDTPERGQPLSDEAVALLSDLVADGEVELQRAEQMRYERMVAIVYANGSDLNAQIVRHGLAMAKRRYLNEFDDGADYCV